MRIYGEISSLPSDVAVAARRSRTDDLVVVVMSETLVQRMMSTPQVLMDLFCQATNALLERPEDYEPINIPVQRLRLVS